MGLDAAEEELEAAAVEGSKETKWLDRLNQCICHIDVILG